MLTMQTTIIETHPEVAPVLLPDNRRFFRPNENFWKYLQSISKTITLVDSGCGNGDLVREAIERGINMLGIDPKYSGPDHPMITRQRAEHFDWGHYTWPLICRPSHEGWAPQTLINSRRHGASCLYVGLENNYRRDIGSVISKRIEGVMGHSNEALYFIRPIATNIRKKLDAALTRD